MTMTDRRRRAARKKKRNEEMGDGWPVTLPDFTGLAASTPPPPPAPSEPSGKIDYVAQAVAAALVNGRKKGGRRDGTARG